MEKFRRRVFDALEVSPNETGFERFLNIALFVLILLNVIAVVLETVESLYSSCQRLFDIFEVASVALFTIEYLLRLWSCTSDQRFTAPIVGRLKFAVTPMAIVDLIAIAPFFIPRLVA